MDKILCYGCAHYLNNNTAIDWKYSCSARQINYLESEKIGCGDFLPKKEEIIIWPTLKGKGLRTCALLYGVKPKWYEYLFESFLRNRIVSSIKKITAE